MDMKNAYERLKELESHKNIGNVHGVINFYDDILSGVSSVKEITKQQSIKDVIEEYVTSKENIIEYDETYNIETGETTLVPRVIDGYKVLLLANMQEVQIDYVIKETDVISIIFIPESKKAMNVIGTIGVIVGAALAVVASIYTGGAAGAALLMVGAAFSAGMGAALLYASQDRSTSTSSSGDSLDSESALTMNGGSNQNLVSNRYPLVMGKHLSNPYVAGSAYNTTLTEGINGLDAGQYLTVLYCVGYSPLRLTNFKIGDTWVAYNQDSDGLGQIETIMHGLLREYRNDSGDKGEILKKWKNNDVAIEILQRGSYAEDDTERYGTLYPQTIKQTEVKANLIKIQDGTLEEVASTVYKGVNIPNGFSTNSVRFSGACPTRLEVELDFSNGLYATRSKTDSSNSYVYYYNLPVRIAVQWRFVYEGEASSDANSPLGWTNFTQIELKNSSETDSIGKPFNTPKRYTIQKKIYDYNSNLGKEDYLDTDSTSSIEDFYINDKWLGSNGYVFEFGVEDEPESVKQSSVDIENTTNYFYLGCVSSITEEYSEDIVDDPYTGVDDYEETEEVTTGQGSDVSTISIASAYKWYVISEATYNSFVSKNGSEIVRAKYANVEYELINGTSVTLKAVQRMDLPDDLIGTTTTAYKAYLEDIIDDVGDITDHGYKSDVYEDQYNGNVNERRYVVSYDFTEAECRQLINWGVTEDADKVSLNCVEVRVLKITPSYLDVQGTISGSWGNMSYQDLCKWTYLRTYSFDKDAYEEALEKEYHDNSDTYLDVDKSSVSVADYPSRPQSEEDMAKFTYVALRLKQDAAETGGSSLNEVSLIAESMGPKYSEDDDTWYPKELTATYDYYIKGKFTDSSSTKKRIYFISEQDYTEYQAITDETQQEEKITSILESLDDYNYDYPNSATRSDVEVLKVKTGNNLTTQIKNKIFNRYYYYESNTQIEVDSDEVTYNSTGNEESLSLYYTDSTGITHRYSISEATYDSSTSSYYIVLAEETTIRVYLDSNAAGVYNGHLVYYDSSVVGSYNGALVYCDSDVVGLYDGHPVYYDSDAVGIYNGYLVYYGGSTKTGKKSYYYYKNGSKLTVSSTKVTFYDIVYYYYDGTSVVYVDPSSVTTYSNLYYYYTDDSTIAFLDKSDITISDTCYYYYADDISDVAFVDSSDITLYTAYYYYSLTKSIAVAPDDTTYNSTKKIRYAADIYGNTIEVSAASGAVGLYDTYLVYQDSDENYYYYEYSPQEVKVIIPKNYVSLYSTTYYYNITEKVAVSPALVTFTSPNYYTTIDELKQTLIEETSTGYYETYDEEGEKVSYTVYKDSDSKKQNKYYYFKDTQWETEYDRVYVASDFVTASASYDYFYKTSSVVDYTGKSTQTYKTFVSSSDYSENITDSSYGVEAGTTGYYYEDDEGIVYPVYLDTYTDDDGETKALTYVALDDTTAERYITNNTAAIFALVLTGQHLKRDAKTYENINMYSLTEAYKYFEAVTDGSVDTDGNEITFKYACNGIISKEVKLETLLQKILITGRSGLKRDEENKYEIVVGGMERYPVLLLNQQNCYSLSNSRSFEEVPSGLQVSFTDEDDNYGSNDIYVMDDGENYKKPTHDIESYQFEYVTNNEQIWSLGRFNLACRIYQREIYQRTVGRAGYLLSYGDIVLLQDSTIEVGTDVGARIVHLIYDDDSDPTQIYGFTTSEPYTFTGETQGVTILQSSKHGASRTITLQLPSDETSVTVKEDGEEIIYPLAKGITNVVLFSSPVITISESSDALVDDIDGQFLAVLPKEGDLLAFGTVGSITIKGIISNIKPKEKEKFELTILPFDDSLYQSGDVMTEFESNMTNPVRSDSEADFSNKATKSDINESITVVSTTVNESVSSLLSGENAVNPGKPAVTATAVKAGITFTRGDKTDEELAVLASDVYSQTITTYTWYLKRGSVDDDYFVAGTSSSTSFTYELTRSDSNEGYPEYDTLATWTVKLVTTNMYGLDSEASDAAYVDTTSYGTWIPNAPTDLVLEPYQEYLKASWDYDDTAATIGGYEREFYGNLKYYVTFTGIGRTQSGYTSEESKTYEFSRSSDGYPEKSEIYNSITDFTNYPNCTSLDSFSVEVKSYDSLSKNYSSSSVTQSGMTEDTTALSNYRTWIPNAPTSVTLTAYQSRLDAAWIASNSKVYGTVNYVYTFKRKNSSGEYESIQSNTVSDKTASYYFDRSTDYYPERQEVYEETVEGSELYSTTTSHSLDDYMVDVYSYNITSENISDTVSSEEVDDSEYLTWIPVAPTALNTAFTAYQDRLYSVWDIDNSNVYGTVKYVYAFLRNSSSVQSKTVSSSSANYYFVRGTDLYPERETVYSSLDTSVYTKSRSLADYSFTIYSIETTSGNISDTLTIASVDDSDYLTWIPNTPTNAVIKFYQAYILGTWSCDTSDVYGNIKYVYTFKYQDTERESGTITDTSATYTFNRDIDGYPEKDGTLDTEKYPNSPYTDDYSIEIYAIETTSGNISRGTAVSTGSDTSEYLTWIPNTPDSATLTAYQEKLTASWSASQTNVYGTIRYTYTITCADETRVSKTVNAMSADYAFSRFNSDGSVKDGYPEKDTVYSELDSSVYVNSRSLLDYVVTVSATETTSGNESEGSVSSSSIDDSDYLTWIPNTPSNVSMKAYEDRFEGSWSGENSNVYGNVRFVYTYKYNDEERDSDDTANKTSTYYFTRVDSDGNIVDGYPEKASIYNKLDTTVYTKTTSLSDFVLEVYAMETTSGNVSVGTADSGTSIDVDDYLTWIPTAPDFTAKFTKENIVFAWTDTNTGYIYGTVEYSIAIAVTTTSDGVTTTRTTSCDADLTGYTYTFNRDTDGYPEKSSDEDYDEVGLEDWVYTLTVTNRVYSDSSTNATLDFDDYLTWRGQSVTLDSYLAKKDGIFASWYANEENTYGDQRFKLTIYYATSSSSDDDSSDDDSGVAASSLDDGVATASSTTVADTLIEWATKTGLADYSYTYDFSRVYKDGEAGYDGYPETASNLESLLENDQEALGTNIENYYVKITSYTTQKPNYTIDSTTENVKTSVYGSWIPPQITKVAPVATKEYISFTPQISIDTSDYGTPYYYIFQRKKGDDADWEEVQTSVLEYTWYFDRDEDGYPEADELAEWKFRAKAVSTAGYQSILWSSTAGVSPDTDTYGTWKVSAPVVSTRVSDRTITLLFSQETLSDTTSTRYGEIQYKIQVMRPDLDDGYYRPSQWYKPAASLNPYASWETDDNGDYVKDDDGNKIVSDNAEDNYKAETYDDDGNVIYQDATERPYWTAQTDDDGNYVTDDDGNYIYEETTKEFTEPEYDTGYITATSVYTQCMPLAGQGLDGGLLGNEDGLRNTTYMFKVVAFNEAGEGDATTVTAVALCTSIMDIVYANEDYKELYVENLSAISSNLGVVKQGAVSGNDYNYWALSNVLDEYNKQWYRGQFRVGGEDEYLLVEPKTDSSGTVILNDSGDPEGYTITFKVGNFEVSSTATNINGEIIVMESDDSLDRTRITPTGTYYEHRETTSSDWYEISHQNTSGLKTTYAYSDDNFIITNQTIAQRRLGGYDVGRPFLSEASEVYHFDTDLNNQNQETNITITDYEEDTVTDVSKSDYVSLVDGDDSTSTLDYTPAILAVAPYSETAKSLLGRFSISFSLGAVNTFTVDFWMEYLGNEEQVLFDIGNTADKVRMTLTNAEVYFNEPADGETDDDGEKIYFNEAFAMDETELEGDNEVVFNKPIAGMTYVTHYGSGHPTADSDNEVTFGTYDADTDTNPDIELAFEKGTWLHVGIVFTEATDDEEGKVYVYLNDLDNPIEFTRYGTTALNVTGVFNEEKDSFLIDELFFDTTVAESYEATDDDMGFKANTTSKIPWGSLDYTDRNFILTADNFITNVFDTDVFKEKVLEVLTEQGLV